MAGQFNLVVNNLMLKTIQNDNCMNYFKEIEQFLKQAGTNDLKASHYKKTYSTATFSQPRLSNRKKYYCYVTQGKTSFPVHTLVFVL